MHNNTSHRSRCLFLILLLAGLTVGAQGPGMRPGSGRPVALAVLYGKIVEAKTGKAIELASVQLIGKSDSAARGSKSAVVAGMITRSNGEFRLENLPVNRQYELKVSVIGYSAYSQIVDLKANTLDATQERDLGNIRVSIEEKQLDNVTVTSTGSGLKLGIDRKVFSVDKNLVATGGTAIDVVRNIPSLSVDLDGNLTMRNNTPQLFVDGRPTNLTLEQLPADAIESIELITNPSAKYDASGGTAGILNVILKKNKRIGYNGSVRANIDSRARVGGGTDLNLRQGKFNFFLNANYNQRKSISTGTTNRTTDIANQITKLNQIDTNTSIGRHAFLRAGVDLFLDNRNTLSITANLGQGRFKPITESSIWIDSLNASGPPNSSKTNRNAKNVGSFDNQGLILGFKHLFPKAGEEWTADLTYNGMTSKNTNDIITDIYPNPIQASYIRNQQQQLGTGKNNSLILQTDYVRPISEKEKWEMGLRAQFRQVDNRNDFYLINTGNPIFLRDLSVNYTSDDRVYAAYTTYTNMLGKWGYQAGLRLESSDYTGNLPDKGQSFQIPFPLSLFPSLYLSRKAVNEQELQLNYTRKINRPNFWQLYPFTDYSDSLNISRGNPDLRPEFTNSIEVSYQKTFKNRDNFIASAYYKRTEGLITRYQTKEIAPVTGKDILINTYLNARSSYLAGIELISKNKITRIWELTTNLNLFQSGIELNDPTVSVSDPIPSWQLKLNHTIKMGKRFTLQLNGEYVSKTVLPPSGSGGGRGGWSGGGGGGGMWGQTSSSAQGYSLPNYFMDAGLRADLGKTRQTSLSINWSDAFRTRRQQVHTESDYFVQDVFRRRDPQLVRLNFNWRFGKVDANLFKRKNSKGGEGMEGMSM